MELSGARFVVVGLGSSGRAAVRVLRAHGADVVANDSRDREALDASLGGGRALDELEALGATLELGGHDAARLGQADGIVVSPGVPRLAVLDEAERAGVPVVSEVELASWFVQSTVIGVTGTNGKSTVTAWVGQMCEASGRPTFVGGNLGRPAVEVVDTDAARGDGLVVLELSSFQLERVDRFHANVAALLNVSDDHLDRYESFDAYAAAKGRIFERQGDDDAAVVPDGDARCAALARSGGGRLMTFGGAKGSVRVDGGQLVDAVSGLTVPLRALQPRGSHNVDNACASTLIARLAGVDAGAIADGLVSFKGLPHRMVRVRVIGSIACSSPTSRSSSSASCSSCAPPTRRRVSCSSACSCSPTRPTRSATARSTCSALSMSGAARPRVTTARARSATLSASGA